MSKDVLASGRFHDENEARNWFEAARWEGKPICPKCGSEKHYTTKKAGLYRCAAPTCRKDFTVMTGTVMERSHAKLTLWAKAFYLLASSKKGFSAHQLHRTLGCEYNTAWFMHHRIMEAMRRGSLEAPLPPMGGPGKIVEADETYFGNIDEVAGKHRKGRGPSHKRAVLALVERGGEMRAFHIPRADRQTVMAIVMANVHKDTRLMTDEGGNYWGAGQHFAFHDRVNHSKGEYVSRENPEVHSNTIEGCFSIFKRGMKGIYQHCGEKHLHRYIAEYDFRYTTRRLSDEDRAVLAVRGGEGKRLTYH